MYHVRRRTDEPIVRNKRRSAVSASRFRKRRRPLRHFLARSGSMFRDRCFRFVLAKNERWPHVTSDCRPIRGGTDPCHHGLPSEATRRACRITLRDPGDGGRSLTRRSSSLATSLTTSGTGHPLTPARRRPATFRTFWNPQMRRAVVVAVDDTNVGADLDPLVRDAAGLLWSATEVTHAHSRPW